MIEAVCAKFARPRLAGFRIGQFRKSIIRRLTMADEVRMIKLSKIVVPEHMRKHSPEKTAELAKDIKVRGQLQDAVVTPMDDGNFELLAGGNRYAAMKLNGAEEIRCLVKENVSPYERSCITLSENIKREDMSPVDLGLELKRAMETGNKTQEELAKDLGLTQGYISQYVTAAELSEPVREIINRLIIGIAHINPIARLAGDAAKIAMLEKIEKEDLSVKQVENLVNKALASSPDPAGQAEAVKQADGAAAAKPKPVAKGVKCVKAGKGFHLAGGFKDLIPMDDFLKAAREAYQPLLDEQAQQAQAEQSKPDPQALKAANDIKKAAKVQITKLKKQLKTALAHLKSQQTSNRDTSGALKDVESIKVDIEAQKLKLKTLDKNPAGVAAKLALPVDPGSEEPTAAKQASQLQDTTGQHQDNLKKAVESGLLGEKGRQLCNFVKKWPS